MPDLTAGPELDAAVAKACDWTTKIQYAACHIEVPRKGYLPPSGWKNGTDEGMWWKDFAPSTDDNAAFEAAEKFGLFKFGAVIKDGWLCLAGPGNDDPNKTWGFMQFGYGIQACWYLWDDGNGNGIGVAQPTPALAICAAILALAKRRDAACA